MFYTYYKVLLGANRELLTKIFLANIQKTYMAYALFCQINFFLANSFYLYGLPKFSPIKIFPMYSIYGIM